jgi:hypothetical protein
VLEFESTKDINECRIPALDSGLNQVDTGISLNEGFPYQSISSVMEKNNLFSYSILFRL